MKNALIFGTLLTLAAFTAPAMAAGTGEAAVQMATQVLGESLHGESSNGQPCELSFERTAGGVLLGNPVLGTYNLTVGGQEAEFSFIASTEAAGTTTDLRVETTIHEDASDSPDEGGFHRGFTSKMDLAVMVRGNTLSLRLINGVSTVCNFTR
jgi:hypothetical protein